MRQSAARTGADSADAVRTLVADQAATEVVVRCLAPRAASTRGAESLARHVGQGRLASAKPSFVLALGCRACEALAELHDQRDAHGRSRSIVHGHIDLAHLLVSKKGAVRFAGVGRDRAGLLRLHKRLRGHAGNPRYRAPEQREGRVPDPRTDLFGLGLVLLELLNGAPLVDGDILPIDGLEARRRQVCANARVGPAAEALLARLLAVEPDDRPASARIAKAEFAELLLAGIPRAAAPKRPPSAIRPPPRHDVKVPTLNLETPALSADSLVVNAYAIEAEAPPARELSLPFVEALLMDDASTAGGSLPFVEAVPLDEVRPAREGSLPFVHAVSIEQAEAVVISEIDPDEISGPVILLTQRKLRPLLPIPSSASRLYPDIDQIWD